MSLASAVERYLLGDLARAGLSDAGMATTGARPDATLSERAIYSALLTMAWMAAVIAIVIVLLPAAMIADAVGGDSGRHLVVDVIACLLGAVCGALFVSSGAWSNGLFALKLRPSVIRSLLTRVARPSLAVTLSAQACGVAVALMAIL